MNVTIRQAASRLAATLHQHDIADSGIEAEVLIRHVLKLDRAEYYASLGDPIDAHRMNAIRALTNSRVSGEPLAYITGRREFFGLDFAVSPAVLIPRQETELLVEIALEFARERAGNVTVADVGTGSGAIAIAIAANEANAKVFAIDCCENALEIASRNVHSHRVTDRVSMLQGDLLEPLSRPVDMIVSNPPYVADHLLPDLQREVRQEPRIALDGGKDGLAVIRRLFEQAHPLLNPGGLLAMEISPEQLNPVRALADALFTDAVFGFRNDLLGLPRCITVRTKK